MGRIFLYGPPGSGKTTVGKLLAKNLGCPFLDLDDEIEASTGKTIAQIMEIDGESGFRERESLALEKVSSGATGVISLGGGALLREANRACAETAGEVIVLEADLPTLLERLEADGGKRPLIAGGIQRKLPRLLQQREEHYKSFSFRITTKEREPDETARHIQYELGRWHVAVNGVGYDIIMARGSLETTGDLLRERGITGSLVVVADTNVGPLYAGKLLSALGRASTVLKVVTIPAGEEHKKLGTVEQLWHEFIQAGLDRKSLIMALGGGVTGDLSGFAASTYMRGIDWVGIPTTLLAMVDSSLGGKTGFDLPTGKNLIGSFHSPRLVVSDPAVLATLPDVEMRSGLAEVVKHAVIGDETLFSLCSSGFKSANLKLDEIVKRAVAVKLKYIQDDPFEQSNRAVLNFGHTVGHAVELVSGFRLRHGEAVSIGMAVEARLAERLGLAVEGLTAEIKATLEGLGLPAELPSEMPRDDIARAMRVDKKKQGGKVRFALPLRIGQVVSGIEIDDLGRILAEE